ncbi:MAG TPA: RNA polymerase sigma factor [Deltaproteobacteria bacterium]|nr:RNA polymerase sigma factor [Deltaproteobacteria bacterium]
MNENASSWEAADAELLRAVARDRDRDAFRKLFDRYHSRVFGFVLRRLQDRELAREVSSDVFVEIWVHAGRFRGESRISSWIFGIAHFKSLEAHRQRRRFKRARVVSTKDERISRVPEPHESGTNLEARQDLRRVGEMMKRLPRDQCEALELVVLEGVDLEEVARRQGVSVGTVKTRVSRARRTLRRIFGAAEGAGG